MLPPPCSAGAGRVNRWRRQKRRCTWEQALNRRCVERPESQEEHRMDENRSAITTMRAITISREYGSGGGEIATRLAQRLGWQLIDHEVVVRVAQKLHVSEEEAEYHDERVESLAARIFKSLRLTHPTMPVTVDIPL